MTNKEQHERRRQIVEYVAAGHTSGQAADKFKVCPSSISLACRAAGIRAPIASQLKRIAKEAKIVEAARAGLTCFQIQARFRIYDQEVRRACAAAGVRLVRASCGVAALSIRMLAELINTNDTYQVIADRFNVTRQRVGQVYDASKQAGIKMPRRLNGRAGKVRRDLAADRGRK